MNLFLDITGIAYAILLLETLSDLGKSYPQTRYISRKDDLATLVLALVMLTWVLVLKWGGAA